MFIWTFLLRITHTIISRSLADSSWITLYVHHMTHCCFGIMTRTINHCYEMEISLLGHNALWRDILNISSTKFYVSVCRPQIALTLKVLVQWGTTISSSFLCVTKEWPSGQIKRIQNVLRTENDKEKQTA